MTDDTVVVIDSDDPDAVRIDPETGATEIDTPDGGVVVNLDDARQSEDDEESAFNANLALKMDHSRLASIAMDLHDAISADDRSRAQWLASTANGLDLLGLEIDHPRSDIGDTAAPIEGMSTVKNPLLLEAILRGWANAVGELLPASGPVKVDTSGPGVQAPDEDRLGEALQTDFNYYLTKIATEYYPDTSHMLLWGVHFRGSGFKKVYPCPMRRRPVSESVDPKDLILSNEAKDIHTCSRVTHQITMRPSVMKRMQHLEAYRDTPLTPPTPSTSVVDNKIAMIEGIHPVPDRPEDQPYTLWECQCELDLDEYAPSEFKGKGIPLPYLVTLDKDTREILALRRDWEEDDEDARRKQMYVQYPYVPGPGIYGTGLLQILGNSNAALTAATREALDAGMFASFPAFIYERITNRQMTNDFRAGPGQGVAIQTDGKPIQQSVMPMPYKDVTPGLMALIDKIMAQAQRVGGTAELPVGEGRQDAPVGTTIALIEQATKVIAAAHKGMHKAQSEEFGLLAKLFRADPSSFWRGNKRCARQWDQDTFVRALDNCNLTPVADPNIPTHLHRVMNAVGLTQLMNLPAFAPIMDPREVLSRVLAVMKEPNAQALILPPQPAGPAAPDPKMLDAAAKQQAAQQTNQVKVLDIAARAQIKDKELAAQKDIETLRMAREMVIHQGDRVDADRSHALDVAKHGLELGQALHEQSQAPQQGFGSPNGGSQ